MITFRVVALSGKEPPCTGAYRDEITVVDAEGRETTEEVWLYRSGETPDILDGYSVRVEDPPTIDGNYWLVIEDERYY